MTPNGNDDGLKAGTPDDLGGSMAEAMEQAFEKTWGEHKETELSGRGRDERRILFVAVAQGILRYLKEHAPEGFEVDVEVTQKDSLVESEGRVTGGARVETIQKSDGSGGAPVKPVRSDGEGRVTINTVDDLYPLPDGTDGGP